MRSSTSSFQETLQWLNMGWVIALKGVSTAPIYANERRNTVDYWSEQQSLNHLVTKVYHD